MDEVTALTAAVALPWALKFLWAPVVDAVQTRRWGLRAWIVTAQLSMGMLLIPLAFAGDPSQLGLLTLLLVAHALAAATQDVAVDALAVRTIAPHERGSISGWMQAGMLLGRAVFGGAAIAVEEHVGHAAVLAALVLCVWWSTVLVMIAGPTPTERTARSVRDTINRVASHLRNIVRSPRAWLGLAIAVTAGLGFEAVGGLASVILVDLGVSADRRAIFFAGPVIVALMVGSLVGGRLADRLGHRAVLVAAVVAIALAACLFAILLAARDAAPTSVLVATLGLIYLLIGVHTASLYALMLDLTDPAVGATQFSAYMAATNLCEILAVASAGRLASIALVPEPLHGYPAAIAVLAIVSLVSLVPLAFLRVVHQGSNS